MDIGGAARGDKRKFNCCKDEHVASQHLRKARVHIHNLSGLLSGVSASLHLSKSGVNLASVLSDVVCAEDILNEAMEEVASLHGIIRILERGLPGGIAD